MDAWSVWPRARDTSEKTITDYERALLIFLRRTRRDPKDVTEDVVLSFLAGLPAKGPARQGYRKALRSFFGWAHRRGIVATNPAEDVRAHEPKYPPPDYYTAEEWSAICAAAAANKDPRRKAAIVLLLETGARVGSLAAVKVSDVRDHQIVFRVAKGDQPYS